MGRNSTSHADTDAQRPLLCCKRSESATSLSISMRIMDHIHIVITAATAHHHINSSHVFALLSLNSVFLSELYVLYHLNHSLSIGKIYIRHSSHIIILSTSFFVNKYFSIKIAIVLLIQESENYGFTYASALPSQEIALKLIEKEGYRYYHKSDNKKTCDGACIISEVGVVLHVVTHSIPCTYHFG